MKIRVNEYNLESQKVNQYYDILAVSDIHSNFNALKCIKHLLTNKVKYLTVLGDILDHVESSEKGDIIKELKLLSQYVRVFISRGDHDNVIFRKNGMQKIKIPSNDFSFFKDLKKETDCLVMTDLIKTYDIDKNSSISSINMPTEWYQERENRKRFYQMLSKNSISINPDKFNILLSHTPNSLVKDNQLLHLSELSDIDLILSGHNHGGLTPISIQNRSKNHIGIVGPYYKISQLNAFGYWTNDDTSLIVSNGMTKVANSSTLSIFSQIMNKIFISDVELIHMRSSDKHNLQFEKRMIYNLNRGGKL